MMSKARFSAVSIGTVAAQRITNAEVGQVHSVFRRVINLEIPNNGLVSVVESEIGKGPLYISIELPSHFGFTSKHIEKDHNVTIDDNLIRLGENIIEIELTSAAVWEPKSQFRQVLEYSDIEVNLKELLRLVTQFGNDSELYQLLEFTRLSADGEEPPVEMNPVPRMAFPHIKKLLDAIKQDDTKDIVLSSQNLVGLGPGLTPAVDDFLVGLMLSMHHLANNLNIGGNRVRNAVNYIISCIPGRTTRISEEFLLQAAIGNGNEPIQTLFEVLLTSNANDLERSVQRVMDFGGTSGIDTTIGILFGANMMLNANMQNGDIF
jgi:hypothetical protein